MALDAGYSVEQVNCHSGNYGMLEQRTGIVPMTTATTTAQYHYSSMYFDHPSVKRILTHGITYAAPVWSGDLWAYNLTTNAYATISQAGITCLSGYSPICFTRDRRNVAFGVNGLGRGFRWDGLTASAAWLGMDAPTAAPTLSGSGTSGGLSVGDYEYYYRFVDRDGYPSNLSPVATYSATAANTVTITIPNATSTDGRASGGWKEVYRTLADATSTVYLLGTASATTTSFSDTVADSILQDNTALPIYNVNGTPNANRFTPPPYHKPFAAFFKDRMFYYGTVEYPASPVGVASGGSTLTSASALFTGMDLSCGQGAGEFQIFVPGQTKAYTITSNTSTSVAFTPTYAGASTTGASVTIKPAPIEERLLYFSEADEPESVPITNAIAVQENTGNYDRATGLMPFGAFLWLLHERNIYPTTFVQQPDVDINISPPIARGCVSNQCWCIADNHAYLMDHIGIYRIGPGGEIESMTDAINNRFQDSTLAWSQSKWWSAGYDPLERIVKFHVSFTEDSLTTPAFPKRSICIDIDTGEVYDEKYVFPISAPALITYGGRTRLTVGSTQPGASTVGVTCLASDGTSDWVSTALRGTVTQGFSTAIRDATNNWFDSSHVGAPIAIVRGTGQGQIRRIKAITSTQATVDVAFDVTPDTTSVYSVGAIEWSIKTGSDPLTKDANISERSIAVCYRPTTYDTEFQVQAYYDHSSSATPWSYTYNTTEGLKYTANNSKAQVETMLTRSSLSNAIGYVQMQFPTPADSNFPINRFLSVRLSGYKDKEQQQIHTLLIEGVR